MSSAKEKILDALEDSDFDLSIGELAERTGISRDTASKYVNVLKAEEKVELSRTVGNAKLYKVKE